MECPTSASSVTRSRSTSCESSFSPNMRVVVAAPLRPSKPQRDQKCRQHNLIMRVALRVLSLPPVVVADTDVYALQRKPSKLPASIRHIVAVMLLPKLLRLRVRTS